MNFVLPVARNDIADTYGPLVEALVAAGHEALVVTTAEVERRCHFALRGVLVTLLPQQAGHASRHDRTGGWGKSWRTIRWIIHDLATSLRRYWLALEILRPDRVLYGYATDAELMRPFMDVATARGNRVVVGQMAFLPADAEGLVRGVRHGDAGRRLSAWRDAAYAVTKRLLIRVLSGISTYSGPRRIWGLTANVLFAADSNQAAILHKLGVREDKILATGVPFMDMIYRRIEDSTPARQAKLRAAIGIPSDGPVLLVATKAIGSLAVPATAHGQASVVQWVARTLTEALPGWRLLFKLHPNESAEAYRTWLAPFPAATANRDMNIMDALSISSALVSFGVSSPSYYAKLIGLPQCVVRWPGMIDAGHMANFPGIPVAEDAAGLAAAVATLLARNVTGGSTPSRAEQFDGHACRRMIRVLEEMERCNAWPAK